MKKLFFRQSSSTACKPQIATQLFRTGFLTVLLVLLAGCQSLAEISFISPTETPIPIAFATATAVPTSTNIPIPPTETAPPPTPTQEPGEDLSLIPSQISIYPVPQLYAGDQATFQVTANVPSQIPLSAVDVDIYLNDEFLVRRELDSRNLGGQARAIIEWAWDTENALGDYTVTLILDPDDKITVGDEDEENNRHELEITVLPDRARPLAEVEAKWITQEIDQAYIHVVAGTAAERDLRDLIPIVEQAISHATETLQEQPRRKFDIYFIDRVIGQGGYAGSAMVVSYLDRNYSGGEMYQVLVHETIHLLDRQFVGEGRLNFLAEGVAVWGTGGHYKPEDIQGRAKALVTNDLYVPLDQLIDDFYPIQHEIGYLQAGAFIGYLVDQYGWETVREFYSAVDVRRANSRSAVVDANLQQYMGKSLAQLEQEWLTFLAGYDAPATAEQDMLTSIRFYNIMRQYQIQYDPTAHFLNAWLPRPNQLRERGTTAELNRHPKAEINLILETMLTEADFALRSNDYQQANVLLNSVERVLANNGLAADPLSKGYFDIITQASEWGYEVHRIDMGSNNAAVLVTNPYSSSLLKLTFGRNQHGWFMLQ